MSWLHVLESNQYIIPSTSGFVGSAWWSFTQIDCFHLHFSDACKHVINNYTITHANTVGVVLV